MIFDGKGFAGKIEERLRKSGKLAGKSLLIVGDEDNIYVRLKKKMGERLGVKVVVRSDLKEMGKFDGVLVQLPVADESILEKIPVEKDVDGLNLVSRFWPAAVVAVEKVLEFAGLLGKSLRVGVVGSEGMVGKRLCQRLEELGLEVAGFDKGDLLEGLVDCDVVVSATGQVALIKVDMVKKGVVAIDLGFPKGDFDTQVADKASLLTPVPGGVGPVTVVSLFENLARVEN